MQDKLLFDVVQGEIDALQDHRNTYRRSEYISQGIKDESDRVICTKIEALEDLRTKLVSKGFFSE